jgi:hypothetical protein
LEEKFLVNWLPVLSGHLTCILQLQPHRVTEVMNRRN